MTKKGKEEKATNEGTKEEKATEMEATKKKELDTINLKKAEEEAAASGKAIGVQVFAILMVGLIVGLLIGLGLSTQSPAQTSDALTGENALTLEAAGQKAIDFVNNNLIPQGEAIVNSVEEKNGVYFLNTTYQENEIPIYMTKDGEVLFIQGSINMKEFVAMKLEAEKQQGQNQKQEQKLEIPKTEKPDVKLFIMTYCPYGLQAEKAFLPAYNLLKDKADMTINFVSYAMHGKKELDENLRHYCIQLEQDDKFYEYASCFAINDDYEKCLNDAKVDKTKLDSCVARVDKQYNMTGMHNDKSTWSGGRFPMFNVEADLNKKYEVRGSPTFVINDKVVSVNRSPEAIKEAVCSAFINPPEECSQKLSEAAASPGFGGGTGESTTAKC